MNRVGKKVVAVLVLMMVMVTPASANSQAELQRLINDLLAQIAKLQSQVNSGSGGAGTGGADASNTKWCEITTDKPSYVVGDTITVSWRSKNFTRPSLQDNNKAGGSFDVPASGSQAFTTAYADTQYGYNFSLSDNYSGFSHDFNPLCKVRVPVEKQSNPASSRKGATAVELFIATPPDKETGRRYFQHYGTYNDVAQDTYEVQIRPSAGYVGQCTVAAVYETKTVSYPVAYRLTVEEGNFDHMKEVDVVHEDGLGDLRMLRVSCNTGRGNKNIVDRVLMKEFRASDTNVATFKAVLNGRTIVTDNNQTQYDAARMCNQTANQYSTYKFGPDDVLKCYWGNELIQTIDQWKG